MVGQQCGVSMIVQEALGICHLVPGHLALGRAWVFEGLHDYLR